MASEKQSKLTQIFRPRVNTLVGVDFGNGAIKVAEVSLSGSKPYLRTMAIVENSTDHANHAPAETDENPVLRQDAEALLQQLRRALSLSGVKAKHAVLAIGNQMVFMREVTFPNLAPEELAEAIRWEIPKYVPYEADSYEYDYAVTGRDTHGSDLKVLVVAAPKLVVNQLSEVVRQAGLKPVAVDIEPLAVFRTLAGADNSLIVDVGPRSTQISLFLQGNPIMTRVISLGEEQFARACKVMQSSGKEKEVDEFADEIGQEIRKTQHFISMRQKESKITQVFITGLIEVELLARYVRTKSDLSIIAHNPLDRMEVSPSISSQHAKKIGPQLAVAVGLAMRGGAE